MNFILDIFESLYKDNPWYLTALFLFAIAAADIAISKRKLPTYIKLLLILSTAGIFLIGGVHLYPGVLPLKTKLHTAGAIILAGALCILLLRYVTLWFTIWAVERFTDRTTLHLDYIKAWKQLKEIPEGALTPKQFCRYSHDKTFLLIMLGNLHQAEQFIQIFKDREPEYYYLSCYLIAFFRGNNKKASEYIQLAAEACKKETGRRVKLEICINQGVQFHCKGDYVNAEDALDKAKQYLKQLRGRDPVLTAALYQNLLANQQQMPGSTPKMSEDILKEYRAAIRDSSLYEYVTYQNTELGYLRQINASVERIDAHAKQTFDNVMNRKLSEKARYIFESSYVRSVWTGFLNPQPCLSAIREDYKSYDKLPPHMRYHVFKELNLLFKSLHGPIVTRYQDLKDYAFWYMQNQAEQDLERYRKELPEEAVYEKAFYLKEKAGLQKEHLQGKYDYAKVREYFRNALSLYESNGLVTEAILLKLDMLDEMTALQNMGEDLRSLYVSDMEALVREIEKDLPALEQQPVLDTVYLRLSFYCIFIDAHDKCRQYYLKYVDMNVSLKHLAPWCVRYYLVASFAVRSICFYEAITRIQNGMLPAALEPELGKWFREYPHEDGYMETLLLGKFLGFDPQVLVKAKFWADDDEPALRKVHHWLTFEAMGWEIDIAYSGFSTDENAKQVFFNRGTHPMERMTSNRIVGSVNRTGLSFDGVYYKRIDHNGLAAGESDLFQKLYKIIEAEIEEGCPSLEVIQAIWPQVMEPVTAIPT